MNSAKTYVGGCHCGNIQLEYTSAVPPSDTEVRECQCSFCRKHGTRAVADPNGSLVVRVALAVDLNRYSFEMETTQFLICRNCGVYAAAITNDKTEPRGIAILNALNDWPAFTRPSVSADYSSESRFFRQARRRQKWTPARVEVQK